MVVYIFFTFISSSFKSDSRYPIRFLFRVSTQFGSVGGGGGGFQLQKWGAPDDRGKRLCQYGGQKSSPGWFLLLSTTNNLMGRSRDSAHRNICWPLYGRSPAEDQSDWNCVVHAQNLRRGRTLDYLVTYAYKDSIQNLGICRWSGSTRKGG